MTKRNKSIAGASTGRIAPIRVHPSPKENIQREKMPTAISKAKHTPEEFTGSNIQKNVPEYSTGVSLERLLTGEGKAVLHNRQTKMIILLVVLSIVAMGTIAGLVWNFLKTDTNESTESANVFISTSISPTGSTLTMSLSTKATKATAATKTRTTAATISTTATAPIPSITTAAALTSSIKTTTATTPMLEVPYNTNVIVLQSKLVIYGGYSFLAVEIRVPSDGLSKSENWCKEYQYLCEHFSRRPTGCSGEPYKSTSPYQECGRDYNSDMDIGNVLSCNPSRNITDLVNTGLKNLSAPARNAHNVFGFNYCGESQCQKSLRGSEVALTHTRGFWIDSERIMFTVCR